MNGNTTVFSLWSGPSALDSSSGIVGMWVRIPAWPRVAVLVSLSKTLNHNCFVLRMGRKAAGPVCCVMHVKEKGLVPSVSGFAPWAPSRVDMCALQIFCIIIIRCHLYRDFLFHWPMMNGIWQNTHILTAQPSEQKSDALDHSVTALHYIEIPIKTKYISKWILHLT